MIGFADIIRSIGFSQAIFLLTGIFQTLGNQYVYYSGAAGMFYCLGIVKVSIIFGILRS
jgi:hypothetical protein